MLGRVVCLVADGFGVGEAPDAAKYGDSGANTLLHIAEKVGGLKLPNLQKLGLGNLGNFPNLPAEKYPMGIVSRLAEKSEGKDTTTGHWEIAGLVTHEPFTLFPNGFAVELVDTFIREAQIPGVLANKAASGTTILDEFGEEHIRTGKPILYTSGDSVFQVAAHEGYFGLERLQRICALARKLTESHKIGRVISRPFIGEKKGEFKRTEHRRDFALSPGENCLDVFQKNGIGVYSVGKIDDIFAHRSITKGNHTGNNRDSLNATQSFLQETRGERAFIFTNLVDFDMLYGHRRDPVGYAGALVELDHFLPKMLSELTENDLLIITADHGCDPTFRGTDHTREFVPLIAYSPKHQGARIADRGSFSDIATTLLEGYGIHHSISNHGESFLCELKKSS